MLKCCFDMWITRQMERFNTMWMADNGNNLILLIKRASLMIQDISCLDLARMEWVYSKRWGTYTVCGQLLCAYPIFHHGCATNKSIFYWQTSDPVLNKLTMTYMFFRTIDGKYAETLWIWCHYVGWVQQTTLQFQGHYFLHDQWQSRTLVPDRAGQRKDMMYCLCGSDEINLPSIFQ
jgi:hypothetical protein